MRIWDVSPGYLNPIEDARVELHDRSYHDVDSTEAAFRIAASGAAADAARKAQPVLLEPVMTLEADVHVEAADDVMRNIESRRGDGSRDSLVRAPLKPSPPLRHAWRYRSPTRTARRTDGLDPGGF